jgi:hypothetical protein
VTIRSFGRIPEERTPVTLLTLVSQAGEFTGKATFSGDYGLSFQIGLTVIKISV